MAVPCHSAVSYYAVHVPSIHTLVSVVSSVVSVVPVVSSVVSVVSSVVPVVCRLYNAMVLYFVVLMS